MSNHRISIDVAQSGQTVIDRLSLRPDDSESIVRLGDYLQELGSGAKKGKIRMNLNAVQASGTVTFSSFVADDVVTVNGVTFTGKASPSGAQEFAIGSVDQDCANNLAAKINASALDKIVGVVGATRRATVALASFVADDTVTINGVIFTGKASPDAAVREQFAIGASDTLTAKNLLAAIQASLNPALAGITVSVVTTTLTLTFSGTLTVAASAHATVTSTIVVITSITAGQVGNLCTLAISAHGSVSAANLASGTEGTEVIFDKNYTAI